MCGILGYITTNKKSAERAKANMSKLLVASQQRGDDATGVCGIIKEPSSTRGVLNYCKAPLPAKEFVNCPEFLKYMKENTPLIMIGHTRAATQGKPENNQNNHPIITKSGMGVVHNGVIYNDKELFEQYKLERDGEVDSEIIVKLIEHYTKRCKTTESALITAVEEIIGSMAIAYVSAKEPNGIYLLSSNNPLIFAYHKPTGIIYFASDQDFLESVLIKKRYYLGIFSEISNRDNYIFKKVDSQTGYHFNGRGKLTQFSVNRTLYKSYSYYTPKKDDDKTNDNSSKTTPPPPPSNFNGNYRYDDEDQDILERIEMERMADNTKYVPSGYFDKDGKYHSNSETSNTFKQIKDALKKWVPKQKKTIKEQIKDIEMGYNAPSDNNFEPDYAITRPRYYTTDQLLYRLEFLHDAEKNNASIKGDETEKRRILNCLNDRYIKIQALEDIAREEEEQKKKEDGQVKTVSDIVGTKPTGKTSFIIIKNGKTIEVESTKQLKVLN